MSIARLMQMGAAGVPAGGGASGDFTSATYVDAYTIPSATNLRGITGSTDETVIYINDITVSTNYLTRITLSSSGDLSTASVTGTSSIAANTKSSLFLEGTSTIWALDASTDYIREYGLGSAYGISATAISGNVVPAGANSTASDNPNSVTFNNDGTKMFIGDFNADGVQEFSLATAYTPSSATYVDNGSVVTQTSSPYAHCWNSDGTKLYVLETASGASTLFQYSLSSAYDVSTIAYDGSLSLVDGPLTSANALGIWVSSDDLSLYVSGSNFSTTAFVAKYSTA